MPRAGIGSPQVGSIVQTPSLRRLLTTLAAGAVALYVAVLALLYVLQERLIFAPSPLAPDHVFSFATPHEETVLDVDGSRLNGVVFRAPRPRGLILYFHGNAGNMTGWGQVAEALVARTGFDVWMTDYPGYGKSEGRISSEAQLNAMARAFMSAAAARAGGAGKVVVYGRSLGSGPAVRLAVETAPAALVLETPFLSLASMAAAQYPFVPSILLKYPMRSDLDLPKVAAPTLVLHGDRDRVIPFAQGRALAALRPGITFVAIPGAGHNDLALHADYWDALGRFLDGLPAAGQAR
jgi:hypothetical protein